MLRKFVVHIIMFFIPVIMICITLELLTRNLPHRFAYIAQQIETEKDNIEVLVLGSSQMKRAINPEWMEKPTTSLTAASQHHNTDFKIYRSLRQRLPKLHTVVLELSYAHLELPHNTDDFWKNSVFLEYYKVDCFDRPTWFKDRLIYFSNPAFFSHAIHNHYLSSKKQHQFNKYGFEQDRFEGLFSSLDYNEEKIENTKVKVYAKMHKDVFSSNSTYLLGMLDTLADDRMNVILVNVPLYKSQLRKRAGAVVQRRDSLIDVIAERYRNVRLLEVETDTLGFNVNDFINFNHLNAKGAKKFTETLEKLINEKL